MSVEHNPQPDSPLDPDSYDLFLILLTRIREKLGVSLDELGRRLGISAGIVDFYEQNGAPLGIIQLRAWLDALDYPFARFIALLDDILGPITEPFVATVFDIPLAGPASGGHEAAEDISEGYPHPFVKDELGCRDETEQRFDRALDAAIEEFEGGGY